MKNYLGILFFVLIVAGGISAQDVNWGKVLFVKNCVRCHSANMEDADKGPALGGVGQRWKNYPIEDLFAYIKDAPKMIESGHEKALEIDSPSRMQFRMPAFPSFSDDDVASILNYINSEYGKMIKEENEPEIDLSGLKKGKLLFRNNCAACHHKNMVDKLVGPGLGGVEARWADYPKDDLYSFIRNPQKMIAKGHERANETWVEYNRIPMVPFSRLSDEEIADILCYVNETYAYAKGGLTFKNNCAACHHENMVDRLVGPGLGGVEARWGDFPNEDLYNFIKNPEKMIESGHHRANETWDEYRPLPMTPFPNLSDEEIKDLLIYIDQVYRERNK